MPDPVTAVLIGAGDRGYAAYGPYALAHPDELRFIAVAEPQEPRRQRFARAHGIPPGMQFRSWEGLLERGKLADAALVTTLDSLHYAPTLAALQAGYHVLLEKPMATALPDCITLVRLSERTGRLLQVCHELRYTSFFTALHQVCTSGRLGQVVTVEYSENMVYWASAHSFVRGHWRNSRLECPKILAKGCHDLDLIYWLFGPARSVQSFGGLAYFRPENAPPGAPLRCTDGCPAAQDCSFYAPRLYLELTPLIISALDSARWWERLGAGLMLDHPRWMKALRRLVPLLDSALDYRGWPVSVISEDTSPEARLEALKVGPWGRCVYHCDNDALDHQSVTMELESGATAVYTMNGLSPVESREIRVDGSRATLLARFTDGLGADSIVIHDHITGQAEILPIERSRQAHGGGDEGVLRAFVRAVRGQAESGTSARHSLESHLVAFAAERSRLFGQVVEMEAFREQAGV